MLALALVSPIKGLAVGCVQLGKLLLKLLYLCTEADFSVDSAMQSQHEAMTLHAVSPLPSILGPVYRWT